jgi:hypothetical protein
VLALASLTIVPVVVDLTTLTIALPDIRASLRASLPGVRWVADAYALTLAAVLRRPGRCRSLLAGVRISRYTAGA